MRKISVFILSSLVVFPLLFSGCSNEKFHIEGTIEGAQDSVLYLEQMSLSGPVSIDSVKLAADGRFAFSGAGVSVPEFYRLRLGSEMINLSIDSTETVTVKGAYPGFSGNYTVQGSVNCEKMKELALKQMSLQAQIDRIADSPELGARAVEDSVQRVLQAYKEDVKMNYIFVHPEASYAYYALFQSFRLGMMEGFIFNPRTSEDDVKVYAAVATSWDQLYPGSERGENLHNIALEGMKNVRIVRNRVAEQAAQLESANNISIIDLKLTDNKGVSRQLSDLKGSVVLLDFHVFAESRSLQRIMALRELYNKYHAAGLEIYQVSEDEDIHFWKTQTAALPWISVHDMNASAALSYNVMEVPTFFLIDRNNVLRKRDVQVKNLDAEIASLL